VYTIGEIFSWLISKYFSSHFWWFFVISTPLSFTHLTILLHLPSNHPHIFGFVVSFTSVFFFYKIFKFSLIFFVSWNSILWKLWQIIFISSVLLSHFTMINILEYSSQPLSWQMNEKFVEETFSRKSFCFERFAILKITALCHFGPRSFWSKTNTII
jgi:hypothetical protein